MERQRRHHRRYGGPFAEGTPLAPANRRRCNPATPYERAEQRGLAGIVSVIGYREDMPQILAASNCCVDASYAGLGLTGTLRESLAVGTPVIGTDIEGNPELIRHGSTGLLVPPRDPVALAEAMFEMQRDPANAERMARNGSALFRPPPPRGSFPVVG